MTWIATYLYVSGYVLSLGLCLFVFEDPSVPKPDAAKVLAASAVWPVFWPAIFIAAAVKTK